MPFAKKYNTERFKRILEELESDKEITISAPPKAWFALGRLMSSESKFDDWTSEHRRYLQIFLTLLEDAISEVSNDAAYFMREDEYDDEVDDSIFGL